MLEPLRIALPTTLLLFLSLHVHLKTHHMYGTIQGDVSKHPVPQPRRKSAITIVRRELLHARRRKWAPIGWGS